MNAKTFTVQSGYTGRDGLFRVYVKDHALPLFADEPLPEGTSVRIVGQRAVAVSQ